MPKRSSKRKPRQKDPFQLAKSILDRAVPDAEPKPKKDREKNPAAVALGRLGGQKGGQARAEKLSTKRRREIAKLAAQARWKTKDTE